MHTQTSSAPHWKVAVDSSLTPVLEVSRLGLITDMDGTISHVAETPEAAVVTPRNRQLLGTMVLMLPLVAAISGRSARDLQARIAIPGMIYIGNHGLERWQDGGRVLNENVRQYRKALAATLDKLRPHLTIGMWIEDKYATASIHYRLTPKPEQSADELALLVYEVAQEHGLMVTQGARLFEIRPPIVSNKGTALEDLVQEYQLDGLIYLGDDMTDIEAMEKGRKLRDLDICRVINIGVRAKNDESDEAQNLRAMADLMVNNVNDVESFLGWLLNALSRSRT